MYYSLSKFIKFLIFLTEAFIYYTDTLIYKNQGTWNYLPNTL